MKWTVALLAVLWITPSVAAAQTTALVGARILDGRGGVVERGTIVFRDGKIIAAGPAVSTPPPDGAERIDATGTTIMPGIINAHGHLTSAIGMQSAPNGHTRENLLRQLTTYAEYGVTTIFSLGEDQDVAENVRQLREEQRSGKRVGARLFISGPVIVADTAQAARAMTDKVAAIKPDVLKFRIDDYLGSSRKMPE